MIEPGLPRTIDAYDHLDYDHYSGYRPIDHWNYERSNLVLPYELAPKLTTLCPHCGAGFHTHYFNATSSEMWVWHEGQYVCHGCGFWYHESEGGGDHSERDLYVALLKKFNLSDKRIPYFELLKWLTDHPSDIYYIHPRRFEQVVQGVLREFMDCEFLLTAESKDGGYDLLAYDTDAGKLLVEVKRYSSERTIGVSFVRHLAGVLVRENVSHGLIVSTSDFTTDSKTEIETLRRKTQEYPLYIDLRTFTELLPWLETHRVRLADETSASEEYWETILKPIRESGAYPATRESPWVRI